MSKNVDYNLSRDACEVLAHAEVQARELNHEYVGTEHILLALATVRNGMVVNALETLGVEMAEIHQEIERLVHRGPRSVSAKQLPLTPRAKRAIEFACEDSLLLNYRHVQPELLLIGLLREPDGVAGQVLRNLGIDVERMGAELFKILLLNMKTVERVVRPLHASIARKRKMREELLAHLSATYDDELTRRDDPMAAAQAAATRFGDPAQLARELQQAVPPLERMTAALEPLFGWRAPETARQWMLRLALRLFGILAMVSVVVVAVTAVALDFDRQVWLASRPVAAMLLLVPTTSFLLGLLYFKIRDAMFGVFGSRKSWAWAILLDVLLALVVAGAGFGFVMITEWNLARGIQMLLPYGLAGIAIAVSALLMARKNGPLEIRDTMWACLDLDEQDGDAAVDAS